MSDEISDAPWLLLVLGDIDPHPGFNLLLETATDNLLLENGVDAILLEP